MIVRIEDVMISLNKIFEDKKFFDTYSTGLSTLDEIYKVVKGYPLFIGGAPNHGKSEFSLELAVSLSIHHGFNWVCYLGESGKIEVAISEIVSKIIGKPFFEISENDKAYAFQFISEKFTFIESNSLTVKEFYDYVAKVEKDSGKKIHGSILDPFNDIKNGTSEFGRTDIWMEHDLKYIRGVSKDFNRVDIVCMHVKEIAPVLDKESGNWFVRAALPSEWANGQVVERRAMTMLLVYKVPEWMKDENGIPYGKGKTFIYNQKPKPKYTGLRDKRCIGWDFKTNRYYEIVNGTVKYMLDKHSSQSKPFMQNYNFDKIEDDNEPF